MVDRGPSKEAAESVPFIERTASTALIAVAAALVVVFVIYGFWQTWPR